MKKFKEIKRAARTSLRKHLWIFVIICLFSAFIHAELSHTLNISIFQNSFFPSEKSEEAQSPDPSTDIHLKDAPSAFDVVREMLFGDEESGKAMAEELKLYHQNDPTRKDSFFITQNGVFARIINSITSGSIAVTLISALNSIFGSRSATVILLLIVCLIVYFFYWFYVKNLFAVITRRIFLEGRYYRKVPMQRVLFLHAPAKWTKAALAMLVRSAKLALWYLTVVGGIIKHYSYILVPAIIAEDPDVPPMEAIKLSSRMMKGHKWEYFRLSMSTLGWSVLDILTFGISGIVFTTPYRMTILCEYYAIRRSEAIENNIEGCEYLCDKYLFEKADRETLEKVYPDFVKNEKASVTVIKSKSFSEKLSDIFGITLRDSDHNRKVNKAIIRKARAKRIRNAVSGTVYPTRLFHIQKKQKKKRLNLEDLNFTRRYSLSTMIAFFFTFSFIGWLWEVWLVLVRHGVFANRGVLHGPWLPIYGFGGVFVLIILYRLRNRPSLHVAMTALLCGTVEYFTSFALEKLHGGVRWWDYTGYFMNINGRVCAEALLVFVVCGTAIVYLGAPILDNLYKKLPKKLFTAICIILTVIFLADSVYSQFVPNVGYGITS